uniref:Uncharacterized protein n=1 Tax=Anopheles stephensi TaxID=30069 RepID=A0A182YRP8_ANOST
MFAFSVLQGVSELTPPIRRWIYLATVFAPTALPILSYGMILTGAFAMIYVFVRAYKNFVFTDDPTTELLEMGRRSLRRGSHLISNGQHRILHRDSYILLKANGGTTMVAPTAAEAAAEQENLVGTESSNSSSNSSSTNNNNHLLHNHNLLHSHHHLYIQPKDQSLLSEEDSPA